MATDTRLGSELAGYRIEALLGRGGMGVVYRATDPELSRPVALKVIAPELAADAAFAERFLQEIEVAASLEHPHVCPVYRAGEAEGELYVCMRLLEQGTLASKVASEGPLPPSQAAEIVSQLASALDLAHSRSLLHRDVKPENVLLDASGNAYLCDFGLAGAIWQQEEQTQLAGTLAYLAPERCEGSPAVPASDQYALACLAYVVLTREPPFTREHEAGLLYAHLREEPPSLSLHALGRADPVLRQALAKDPAERYPTCGAFASELAAALSRPERPGGEDWPEGLPRPATRLVGRQAELTELRTLLEEPETRLLTLTGPGGTGKTRLALQAAAESADAFADGVHWVSLAPLRDPAYALSAIAQALEVQEQPPASLVETLREALQGRNCLLVLDNAEHLLPEIADDIAALRDIQDGPTLLCTSRERLDLQAERLYPVPSLQEAEAAELFSDRASYLDSDHDPEDPAIAELCARLDSLPLALELAAARSDLYSPAELLEALAGHVEVLKGARDHDPRHQTLAATIAWSYDLLSNEEQRAFRALSVFAGGCTAEAAHEVAGAEPALLASLVAKSLLRTRETPSGRRYFMLETIRQYAGERLEEAGEEEARERHAGYYCGLAVASEEGLDGEVDESLTGENDNLRVAFSHALTYDPASMLAAVVAVRRFAMGEPAFAHEIFDLTEVALVAVGVDAPAELRGSAHLTAGTLATMWGFDGSTGVQHLDTAIEILRQLDSTPTLAEALNSRANAAAQRGDWPTARAFLEEGIALFEELGDTQGYGMAVGNLGLLTLQQGDLRVARPLVEKALDLRRDSHWTGILALLELCEGNEARASELAKDALFLADSDLPAEASDPQWILARCDLLAGDLESARSLLAASFDYFARTPDDGNMSEQALTTATYAARIGATQESLQLVGATDALVGGTPFPRERSWYDEVMDATRAELSQDEIDALVERGRSLPRGEVIELAQRVLATPVPEST